MIAVYFETPNGSYAERVAVFNGYEAYEACITTLRKMAHERRYMVTEDHDYNPAEDA
jgi:hypothetical protein